MRLVNFLYNNKKSIGICDNELIYDLEYNDMLSLINDYSLEALLELDIKDKKVINRSECKLFAPIEYPQGDIICLGVNYLLHKEESARYKKEAFSQERDYAVYFSKRANKIITDNDFIDGHFDLVDSLDYEVELAFVIGKDATNVSREDALSYVYGYVVLNDISARNIQTRHKQWYFGKSMDTFTITNDALVTRDEIKDLNLEIKSYVNGELRQNSNTSELIYDIPHIIEELSKGFTLKAGTIISTGTPSGVGMGFVPPKFLKSGDVVKCYIEKIGEIENIVK